jgi:hypothetical protein
MKQVLIITTTLLIGAMLFDGVYNPNSPLMWMASTATAYAYVRLALIVILLGLLAFRPPRSFLGRIFLTVVGLGLVSSTLVLVGQYDIAFLDAIVFVEVSIIFLIEALETDQLTLRQLGAKTSALGQV